MLRARRTASRKSSRTGLFARGRARNSLAIFAKLRAATPGFWPRPEPERKHRSLKRLKFSEHRRRFLLALQKPCFRIFSAPDDGVHRVVVDVHHGEERRKPGG